MRFFQKLLLLIELVSWNNLINFPFGARFKTLTARAAIEPDLGTTGDLTNQVGYGSC